MLGRKLRGGAAEVGGEGGEGDEVQREEEDEVVLEEDKVRG